MGIITLLVLGTKGAERDRLIRALRSEFESARVFEAENAREAYVLLDDMLIDGVVAVRAADNGEWASFIQRWMRSKPGWRDIPFLVAADADDCRALRRTMDARQLAAACR